MSTRIVTPEPFVRVDAGGNVQLEIRPYAEDRVQIMVVRVSEKTVTHSMKPKQKEVLMTYFDITLEDLRVLAQYAATLLEKRLDS